ncbi:hypothetical protein LJC68_09355 [Bacteroidales bacterium OttesenSCG-928-B11]|nr:hypothetical protein [Bacteroidales bacterium OttesenSCG-928-E04]MDL2313068.1 hypothetical protein [Bacteroidales bacterium OttesenSCG-928-B11]MDL2326767.1 hypothetical protein [Bacteroidales bacterium OttesenSCG-928-A14]
MRLKSDYFKGTYVPAKRKSNRFTAAIAIFCCILLMLPAMLSAGEHKYTYDSGSDSWSWSPALHTASGDVTLDPAGQNPTVTGLLPAGITSLTVNGAITLGQDITTTGAQTYDGNVTLNGNWALSGASIAINGTIGGGGNGLALTGTGTTSNITLNEATGLNVVTIDGGHAHFNSGTFRATTVTITNGTGVTTSAGSSISATNLNITLSSGSVGKATPGTDGNGSPITIISPVYTDVTNLTVSTQSTDAGEGSVYINNSSADLLVNINTNGDKSANDAAVVSIVTTGTLQGGIGATTHIDAIAANLQAEGRIGLTTKIGALNAVTTGTGDIVIANNETVPLLVYSADARFEGGSASVQGDGSIKVVASDGKIKNGTSDVNIVTQGDLMILGDIRAPDALTLLSSEGSIYVPNNAQGIALGALTGKTLTLIAKENLGTEVTPISSYTENPVTLTTENGEIHFKENNRLSVANIRAGITGNQNATITVIGSSNLWFPNSTSKIAAKKLTLDVQGGNISSANPSYNVIVADSAIISAKTNIGPLTTTIGQYLQTVTLDENVETKITNTGELTGLNVTTNGGAVAITYNNTYTNGALGFNASELTATGANTDFVFKNEKGDVAIGNVNVKNISVSAQGNITQVGTLTATNATLESIDGTVGTTGNPISTAVSSLNLITGSGGAVVSQNGTFELTGSGLGDISVNQTGGDMTLNTINTQGAVKLNSSGAITSAGDIVKNITSTGLDLTAAATIGTATAPIKTSVAGDFKTIADGNIYIDNNGNITLTANSTNGNIAINNIGNISADKITTPVAAGSSVTIDATGTFTAKGTDEGAEITTNALTLTAKEIGTQSNYIDVAIANLKATSTRGGTYINSLNDTHVTIESVVSTGTVDIKTAGDMTLKSVSAPNQQVTLTANGGTGIIVATTPPDINVEANILTINGTAAGEWGTRVNMVVGGGSDIEITNAGPIHLESVTSGNISATGTITIADGSHTLTGNLALTSSKGNIIFLNTDNTINAGANEITLKATGTQLEEGETGSVGNILVGNITSSTGNIVLEASKHIGISTLTSTDGNVTVRSTGGFIVDLNGSANNITGNNIYLFGKLISVEELGNDVAKALADVAARTVWVNTVTNSLKDAQGRVDTEEELMATNKTNYDKELENYNAISKKVQELERTVNTHLKNVQTAKKVFETASYAVDALEMGTAIAQLSPFGDGGASVALAAVKLALSTAELALGFAEDELSKSEDELADELLNLNASASSLLTYETALDGATARYTTAVLEQNRYADLLEKAEIAAPVSDQLEMLAKEAQKSKNPIGTLAQHLGVTVNRYTTGTVNATADGGGHIYLTSDQDLPLGALRAAGDETVIRIEAARKVALTAAVESTKEVVFCGSTLVENRGGSIKSDQLLMNTAGNIGASANKIATDINRLAISTDGDAYINNNSATPHTLFIDELLLAKACGTSSTKITGVTADGTVNITTAGALQGTNIPSHITATDAVLTAGDEIGTELIPIRTDITILTDATSTDGGDIRIDEKDDLEIVKIKTAADIYVTVGGAIINGGSINVNNGVTGDDLILTAEDGIGKAGNVEGFLVTNVANLTATTTAGGIYIYERNNITLKEMRAPATISVISYGASITPQNVTAFTVELNAAQNIVGPAEGLTATNLVMRTHSGTIGTAEVPLTPNVTHLAASAGKDIFVNNYPNTLTITGLVPAWPSTAINGVTAKNAVDLTSEKIIGTTQTNSIKGPEVTLHANSGLGENALAPLWIDADHLNAETTTGDIFIKEFGANLPGVSVDLLHTGAGSLNFTADNGAVINTDLDLTGNALFATNANNDISGPAITFMDTIAPNNFSFHVNGNVIFDGAATWEANTTEFYGNDTMFVDGYATINKLLVMARRFAGEHYDIVVTTRGVTGCDADYNYENKAIYDYDFICNNVTVQYGYYGTVVYAPENKILRIFATNNCTPEYDRFDGSIVYQTNGIESNCWMIENLRAKVDGAYVYYEENMYPDTNTNYNIFGRLYSWETATNNGTDSSAICPDGWRLPSLADVQELIDAYDAEQLKSTQYWMYGVGNNWSTFDALPGGYYDSPSNSFMKLMGDAYFWIYEEGDLGKPTAKALHLTFSCDDPLIITDFLKSNGASVRCVRVSPYTP